MQCDWKSVDLDKAPASGRFRGLWRGMRLLHWQNVTFAAKKIAHVHNAQHLFKHMLSNFSMPCHTKEEKKTFHTQTLKHYKMSHPCLTVFLWPQIQCITYFQHETWACFDEHKTGILINWEPAGSTAVGVTFWVGTAHTELLGNCLFVFFKFKSVLKSWWVVVRL